MISPNLAGVTWNIVELDPNSNCYSFLQFHFCYLAIEGRFAQWKQVLYFHQNESELPVLSGGEKQKGSQKSPSPEVCSSPCWKQGTVTRTGPRCRPGRTHTSCGLRRGTCPAGPRLCDCGQLAVSLGIFIETTSTLLLRVALCSKAFFRFFLASAPNHAILAFFQEWHSGLRRFSPAKVPQCPQDGQEDECSGAGVVAQQAKQWRMAQVLGPRYPCGNPEEAPGFRSVHLWSLRPLGE